MCKETSQPYGHSVEDMAVGKVSSVVGWSRPSRLLRAYREVLSAYRRAVALFSVGVCTCLLPRIFLP